MPNHTCHGYPLQFQKHNCRWYELVTYITCPYLLSASLPLFFNVVREREIFTIVARGYRGLTKPNLQYFHVGCVRVEK